MNKFWTIAPPIGIGLLVIGGLAYVGVRDNFKPPEDKEAAFQRRMKEWGDRQPVVAAVEGTVDVRSLTAAYHENEIAADSRFKGRRFVVVGEVRAIERMLGNMVIQFGGVFRGGQCAIHLRADQEEAAGQLRRGQRVTIQATITGAGAFGTVRANDGVIVHQ